MSGFIGIVNFDGEPVDRGLLENMLAQVAYLGPDATAISIDGAAGFAHALFRSTREAADEKQPLTIGNLTIVADARIDGRQELVCKIQDAGYDVSLDAPDVNLILAAYRTWGEACIQYLIGDFVFMIWDKRKRQVWCARDHFGIRPVYYARLGSTLVVANQIGAVRLHPKVTAALNDHYIADFLLYGNNVWLDKSSSAFADIYRIPPAHQLYSDSERLKLERYWSLPTTHTMLQYHSEEEYISDFRQVLNAAVKDRLRGERSAISMSGGLDSTSLAAITWQLVQAGEVDTDITAVTRVYDRIHPDHEAYYSTLAARKLGIPHHISSCDRFLLKEPLPITAEPKQVVQNGNYEEGVREAASFGTHILLGHGADELLVETPLYQILRAAGLQDGSSLFFWLWHFLGHRPALGNIRRYVDPRLWKTKKPLPPFDFPIWLNPDFERRLDLRARWDEYWNWEPPTVHRLHPNAYKYTVFPNRVVSIEFLHPLPFTPPEASLPFLDLRVVNFIMSLPPQPWFNRKYLLRRAMRNILPREVVSRPKERLGYLLKSLLEQPEVDWVDKWAASSELSVYVNHSAIPSIADANSDRGAAFINIRPMLLNRWLMHRNGIYGK